MMMKSPSSNTRLLPIGGSSRWRCCSIQRRRLNACRDGMSGSLLVGLLITAAGNRYRRARLRRRAVEIDRGERATPDAAGIQPDDIIAQDEPEGGPVTENHPGFASGTVLEVEPRPPGRSPRRRL